MKKTIKTHRTQWTVKHGREMHRSTVHALLIFALKQLRDVEQISFQFVSKYNQRSSTGSLFQTQGPWTTKLRSPYFVLVLGTTSCLICEERRWRRPVHVDVDSQYDCRYCGAAPCWHLYARTAVMNVIHCRIGSQWSSRKTAVIRSHLVAPVTRRAAAFWTTCSFCSSWLLTPVGLQCPRSDA